MLSALVGVSATVAAANSGRVMPGVRIGEVALGGLTRDEAEARLREKLPSLTAGIATVVVDGVPTRIPYDEIGRGYEWEAMLDAAFTVARSGNMLTDGLARIGLLAISTELPVRVHGYEADAIDEVVTRIAVRFTSPPIGARALYDPASGFSVRPASPGRRLEASAIRAALGAAISVPAPDDVVVTLSTSPVESRVTTAVAQAAVNAARAMSRQTLTVEGEEGQQAVLSADDIAGSLVFGPGRDSAYEARADITELRAKLAPSAELFVATPRNASFVFGTTGVVEVTAAVDGRSLNLTRTALAVMDALNERADGASVLKVEPVYDLVPAMLTTEAAEAAAPRLERISTWTTNYTSGIGNFYSANISIPAQDLNGLVLAPGEWFDFWERIGPVTEARGYGYGGAIIGGRSTPNGVLAGGICSTSTTLFNAAMRGGLEMGERQNHYYYIARYPLGLDATVYAADTYKVSMAFRNDTAGPIVIRAYTASGMVRFDIWGVPTGRTVSLSAPIISNRKAARETTIFNPSLAPGTSVRVEGAYNGFDASVTRTVRDAAGTVIHVDTWISNYRA
ncbi:MAG: VanW family protein, partial [Chloroflexota bacterium]|nr:VanW family protein [Chloroflexota bacterium]